MCTTRASLAPIVVEEPDSPILTTAYVNKDNLRYVLPYYFDFKLHVKRRMAGQTLVDLFCNEFPAKGRDYYEVALREGRLRAEGVLGPKGLLKEGQCCRHFLHRHEPPVPAGAITVIAVTDDIVAVNKPAGMPVHVAGQYRKNTVQGVLEAERPDLGKLSAVHRLDKPVSGVLLFSRNPKAADTLRVRIQEHSVEKVYLARVQGRFPHDAITVDAPLTWDGSTGRGSVAPLVDGQLPANAKSAVTEVTFRSYDASTGTSLVECRPRTGRTHQIRLHLAHLGFPIGNDGAYGGSMGAPLPPSLRNPQPGDAAATGAPSLHAVHAARPPVVGGAGADCCAAPEHAPPVQRDGEEAARGQVDEHLSKRRCLASDPPTAEVGNSDADRGACGEPAPLVGDCSAAVQAPEAAAGHSALDGTVSAATEVASEEEVVGEASTTNGVQGWSPGLEQVGAAALVPEEHRDALCEHCPHLMPRNYPISFEPLWLHAFRYKCSDWSFEAHLPNWGQSLPVT